MANIGGKNATEIQNGGKNKCLVLNTFYFLMKPYTLLPWGEFYSKQWFKYLFYGYTTVYKSFCYYHMVIKKLNSQISVKYPRIFGKSSVVIVN